MVNYPGLKGLEMWASRRRKELCMAPSLRVLDKYCCQSGSSYGGIATPLWKRMVLKKSRHSLTIDDIM